MVDKYQETLARLQDTVKLESQKKSLPRGKQQITKLLQKQLMNNLEQKPWNIGKMLASVSQQTEQTELFFIEAAKLSGDDINGLEPKD